MKFEVMQALARLLQQIGSSPMSSSYILPFDDGTAEEATSRALTSRALTLVRTGTQFEGTFPNLTRNILSKKVHVIIGNAHREFEGAINTCKTEVCHSIVTVLKELCIALRASSFPKNARETPFSACGIEQHVDVLMKDLLKAAEIGEPLLSTNALATLQILLELHRPRAMLQNGLSTMKAVVSIIVSSIKRSSPKVRSHALLVCGSLVPILEEALKDNDLTKGREAGAVAGRLFSVVHEQMTKDEIDLEVSSNWNTKSLTKNFWISGA